MVSYFLKFPQMQFLKVYLVKQHIDEHCFIHCLNQAPSPKVNIPITVRLTEERLRRWLAKPYR